MRAALLLLPSVLAGSLFAQGSPRVSGYIQARETFQEGPGFTSSLNRVRVGADGSVGSGFTYRVLVEYEAAPSGTGSSGVSLRDAFIRWAARPGLTLTAGQFKVPFSREFLTSITAIETADRAAAVETIAPRRDIGVMVEYDWRSTLTFSLGGFNGEGQNQPVNRDSTAMVAARAAVRPLPFLSLAANVARSGSDSTRYGADAALEYRGALLRFEYLGLGRDAVSRDDHGWFVLAGYRVLPWIQLVVRREDFERPSVTAFSRNRAWTGGVNLDFAETRVRLVTNYVSRKIGDAGATGTLLTQLQVRF